MRLVSALTLASLLALGAARAQEAAPPSAGDSEDGFSLLERGMMQLFRGLAEDMEPALEGMARDMEPALRNLAETMGPKLAELAEMIGEFDQYHPPERLDNGDIIIRRKTPEEPDRALPPRRLPPEGFDPEGEIEL